MPCYIIIIYITIILPNYIVMDKYINDYYLQAKKNIA